MPWKVIVLSSIMATFGHIEVASHGYMYVPTNRASMWRVDRRATINFNDNAFFCGGFYVQYYINDGKCGPCGDDWRDPVPRSNENGGFYGKGIVLSTYTAGEIIEVHSLITANHLGSLYFGICKLDESDQPETEECFKPIRLADGTASHPIKAMDYEVVTYLKLPDDFVCERCVLRWHYRAGNSWGVCQDGTQNMGCGNQEIFRSCADIKINPPTTVIDPKPENEHIPDSSEERAPEEPRQPNKESETPRVSNYNSAKELSKIPYLDMLLKNRKDLFKTQQ